jgi:dTMP kinase
LPSISKPLFISIEGPDGAGKTTHATKLVERLKAAGVPALYVREPGGTPAGEELRRILKAGGDITPRAELLMFEAARAEIVEKVIQPTLDRGEVVVADRFADSSLAYQAYGRGLPLEDVRMLNRFATGGLTPDLSILLDVPAGDAALRTAGRDGGAPGPQRRFEQEPEAFHRRVAEGYRRLAEREPARWRVVDATRPVAVVAAAVWAQVAPRLGLDPQ